MEEKKEITISLKSLLLIIAIIFIIVLGCFTFKFYNNQKESAVLIAELKNEISTYEQNQQVINKKNDIYSKYVNINWLVKERLENDNLDFEHVVYGKDLNKHYPFLDLKDGKLYYIPSEDSSVEDITSNNLVPIDTIQGNVEFVFLIHEKQIGAFESFYAITDDGGLWKNDVHYDGNYNSFKLVKKFDSKIIDICFITDYSTYETIDTVYYLLDNGELLDIDDNSYYQ